MTNTLPVPALAGNLEAYLAEIRRYGMLAPEEEYVLATRWRNDDDIEAAHRMVTSHLRLVVKIAYGYSGYGLPVADLIAEGNIGLMQAVHRFDPERGFRLATYAMWWIRAAIQEYILRSWSLVRIGTTAAQKKLFFNLRKVRNRLKIYDSGTLSDSQARQIAHELDVPVREVESMNVRMQGKDASLNARLGPDSATEWLEQIPDHNETPQTLLIENESRQYRARLLHDAMGELTPREQDIITARCLRETPETLEELGRRHGVSRERIRQIEGRAMDRLRRIMVAKADGQELS